MTHAQLVRKACSWLRKTERCCVVMREASHLGLKEIPDAIGWRPVWVDNRDWRDHVDTVCTVVECKISRSDVLSNRRKPPQTLGRHRYLLTIPGIASESDLPDGWGLLILQDGGFIRRVARAGWNWSRNERHEQVLLVAELRRKAGGGYTNRKNGLVMTEDDDET